MEITATSPQEVLADASEASPGAEEPAIGHSIKQELPTATPPESLAKLTAEKKAVEFVENLSSLNKGPSVTDSTVEQVDDAMDPLRLSQEAAETTTTANASLGNDQDTGALQVIIVNQSVSPKPASESLKRPTARSDSEPPAKRKRGRRRKMQSAAEPETDPVSDLDDQEATSPEVDAPVHLGISVEIVKPPYQWSNSASSEAMRSNTQMKDPEQSSETSPPTDIEMRDANGPNIQTSPPSAGLFTDPELSNESVEPPMQTGQPNQRGKTNMNPYESERIEDEEEPESSPLSPARSLTCPLSTQPQEKPEEPTNGAEHQAKPEFESESEPREAEQKPEPEQLEVTIKIQKIKTPSPVITQILKLDGRKPDGKTGNSWKEFRCYRNNQDIGSLWELREAWYLKQT